MDELLSNNNPLYQPIEVVNQTGQASDAASSYLDSSWTKSAFLIDDSQISEPSDVINRRWSSASAKFTDTRLGCNIGINPRPQFTRYSDIRHRGRLGSRTPVGLSNTSGNHGMGRYYSEAIDDNAQIIYMRFGVPQFNSLTTFLSKAFDPELSSLARTGRGNGVFFTAGQALGTVAAFVAFPVVVTAILVGRFMASIFKRPISKYYTMKPTMHSYWSVVNMLVNNIAINRGIMPKILADENSQRLGKPFVLDPEYLSLLSKMMPGVFRENFFFDMYAMANRAQRLANFLFDKEYQELNQGSSSDYTGYLKKDMSGDGKKNNNMVNEKSEPTLSAMLNRLVKIQTYVFSKDSDRLESNSQIKEDGTQDTNPSFLAQFAEHTDADFRAGSQFVAFRVNSTGAMSESFSSSVTESDMSQKLNSVSSQVRQARFSFADGNIVGGIAGDVVQGAIGAASDFAQGAASGVTMGAFDLIKGLAGSGYIDIPKHWQSSTANLARANYSMTLISPYGNPISQMIGLDIPLSMLMAGALPLSTGKQSYTSPFLCQTFDRGRCQIRLGMIESLQVVRGKGNLPFSVQGKALSYEVSFTVVDLSSILHMPISTGGFFDLDIGLDEDNILCDYLAVLAGQDMYTQIYPMAKAKLNVAKKIAKLSQLTSPAYWASAFHDSATSGAISVLTLGAFNVLEGVARSPDVVTGSIIQ